MQHKQNKTKQRKKKFGRPIAHMSHPNFFVFAFRGWLSLSLVVVGVSIWTVGGL